MKTKNVILLIILLCLPMLAKADLIFSADSAYNKGNYNEAINYLLELEQKEGISSALLFDLGNSYYMTGDLGNAMLAYERAYRIDPYNADIRNNLLFLKNKVEDANRAEQRGKRLRTGEDDPTFFQSVHNAIAVEITSDRWAVWGAVSFFLLLVCLALYIFTRSVMARKVGFFGGFILLGVTVICIIFSFLSASAFNEREHGVITAYKIELSTEPSADKTNQNALVLTRGTKVRVIAEETDVSGNVLWYKVRLNSDYIGWIKAEDLEII